MFQTLSPRDAEQCVTEVVKKSFPFCAYRHYSVKVPLKAGQTMQKDAAQTIALQALGWIAASDELFPVFLAATGASLAELRSRAADPLFLAAVLDFLLQEDAWVLDFCSQNSLPPASLQAARAALPGGTLPHWT